MSRRDRLSGNEAVAEALRQINPDVMAAFPITPSTEIPQYFSKLVAAKNNIDALNANFAIIDAEIKELEGIIALFDELTRAKNVILADDVKIAYRKFLKCQKTSKALKSLSHR